MRPIPESLLQKIEKQNQTIYENAEPKMSVSVARARSSVMDSTYWTIETIREKEGLGDISLAIRRQVPYGYPDRIYEIHIDNGIAKTAYREYPDKLKEGWKNGFDLEAAQSVAIAFDGRWERNSRKTWQMVTDEEPYVFWANSEGELYVQLWDDIDSKLQMSTGVVKCAAIRGWKSVNGVLTDQGIVCAYIKTDGKVYYRNYCEQIDGTFAWEIEREITQFTSPITSIGLFRTNDYRTGFITENSSGEITWLITARSWSGMASPPETLTASVSAEIDFLPVEYVDIYSHDEILTAEVTQTISFFPASKLSVAPISIARLGADIIGITFNDTLASVEGHESAFTVTNDTNSFTFDVTNLEFDVQTKILSITVKPSIDPSLNLKVVYTGGLNGILVVDDEYGKLELSSFEIADTGQPPNGYEIEYLSSNITTTIALVELQKFTTHNTELLTASVSVIVQLWDVDQAPI